MNFIHVGFGMGLWTLGAVYTPPLQYFDSQVDFSVLNGRASIGNEAVQGVWTIHRTPLMQAARHCLKVSSADKGV